MVKKSSGKTPESQNSRPVGSVNGTFLKTVLDALPHPFHVIDPQNYTILFANAASGEASRDMTCFALSHGRDTPCSSEEHPCPLEEIRKTGQAVVMEHIHKGHDGGERIVEVHGFPVLDAAGQLAHVIEFNIDVTEKKRAEKALQKQKEEQERLVAERTEALEKEIAAGKRREETIRRQSEEIQELSTPVMQIRPGIVLAPLIGVLDSQRTQQLSERLLQHVVDTNSSVALLDITGVPTVDTQTAQHLIETITATGLLGARVVLTGIRPAIAQTLVHLGIDLSKVNTRSSLASGLDLAADLLKTVKGGA